MLTASRADAEDLVQEALLRAWRNLRHRTDIGDPERYVKRAMVNVAKNRWRRDALLRFVRWSGEQLDPTGADPDISDRGRLMTALRELAPKQRAVVVLRYWEDLPERRPHGCSVARQER